MKLIALGAAVLALSAPILAHAQPTADDQTPSVAVHYGDLDLSRTHQASVLLRRVGEASLEACGASDVSVPQYRAAVRDSDCYRTNMQQAVATIDAPTVTSLYNHRAAEVMVGTK